MLIIKKITKLNKINLLNALIALIPLSIILGNLAININILVICLIGLFIYGVKIFNINNKLYKYLIYSFFLYLIIITLYNYVPTLEKNNFYKINIYKSFFYLRFLLFFLIINKLLEKNEFQYKYFFSSCAFFSFFLSIDIIIQVIFKKDLIGYPISSSFRPSGFFGKEAVAGGYLQRFILFFIFFLILNYKNIINNDFKKLLLFLLFLTPIFLTGNRMPTIVYIGMVTLFFLIEKKFREIILTLLFVSIVMYSQIKKPLIYNLDSKIKVFYMDLIHIVKETPHLFYYDSYSKDNTYDEKSLYLAHFNSGIQIWKDNKLFGNGLKSFPIKCKFSDTTTCNTHPHNYVIEILVDTGLFGLFLFYLLFLTGLLNFKKTYLKEKNKNIKLKYLILFLIIFFELFPFRSTGSFFTTSNSVFIFLILAIFLNIKKIRNYK